MTNYFAQSDGRKAPRLRTKFLTRYIIPSDEHEFVTRLYDLGIVSLHLDSYRELSKHSDCKYAFDTSQYVSTMARRVESLNMVGNLIWPAILPTQVPGFPASAYQWLTITSDVFLMRFVSVVDCAIILTNEVYECGLEEKKCSIESLRKAGVPARLLQIISYLQGDQGDLRHERNSRFHHGYERRFTSDDQTFQATANILHLSGGVGGFDSYGRKINVERFLKEGLVELQRDFNRSTRRMVKQLHRLYDHLWEEFEERFGARVRASTHGMSVTRGG